jgi:two-component system sensor histidine kinase ChvG
MTASPAQRRPPIAKSLKTSRPLMREDWEAEDWEAQEIPPDHAPRNDRLGRGIISIYRSPLARKIVFFNLLAIVIMVAGALTLSPFRVSLALEREKAMVARSELTAQLVEARVGRVDPRPPLTEALTGIDIAHNTEAFLFDANGLVVAKGTGAQDHTGAKQLGPTVISDFLSLIWDTVSAVFPSNAGEYAHNSAENLARSLFSQAIAGKSVVTRDFGPGGGTVFTVASPIRDRGEVIAVIALSSTEGEIDRLISYEREQVLRTFLIALLVSIGLSMVLASTIANPLADLAAAVELGGDTGGRRRMPGRVRIPDLTGRPDEIGRLSVALRGMVAALYDRIDSNEQFASDVAHEIKNPLASLRSAVGTLRLTRREDQRNRLLEVIEHDVQRMNRLVSDISNASRLDSELVKEEEEDFDLTRTLRHLTEYLGEEAKGKGIEFITDFPPDPIRITGLEGRLAQVFVNLITNAISFCEDGDAVRVWMRKRDNRILVVVEDTGPGIPEQALEKVFTRFYSERPSSDFGKHSGLGLAISKQIVQAHGGVIWAENIRPTHADPTSEPRGARFVVGLPV